MSKPVRGGLDANADLWGEQLGGEDPRLVGFLVAASAAILDPSQRGSYAIKVPKEDVPKGQAVHKTLSANGLVPSTGANPVRGWLWLIGCIADSLLRELPRSVEKDWRINALALNADEGANLRWEDGKASIPGTS